MPWILQTFQAIHLVSTGADKQRLWNFLDTDLHDSEGTLLDADEKTEVAMAYAEYEAGNFLLWMSTLRNGLRG